MSVVGNVLWVMGGYRTGILTPAAAAQPQSGQAGQRRDSKYVKDVWRLRLHQAATAAGPARCPAQCVSAPRI